MENLAQITPLYLKRLLLLKVMFSLTHGPFCVRGIGRFTRWCVYMRHCKFDRTIFAAARGGSINTPLYISQSPLKDYVWLLSRESGAQFR